jgi:hypothetical protein
MPIFHNLDGTTKDEFQLGKSALVKVRNNAGVAEFTNNGGSTWHPLPATNGVSTEFWAGDGQFRVPSGSGGSSWLNWVGL